MIEFLIYAVLELHPSQQRDPIELAFENTFGQLLRSLSKCLQC